MALEPKVALPQDGRLAAHSLTWLLGTVGVLSGTCVLGLSRKKLQRRFVIHGGLLQALVSNAREDRLFDWLLARGEIDLPEATRDALRDGLGDQPLSAGALVATRAVTPERVAELLVTHLRELLSECSNWGDATFQIRPGHVDLGTEPAAAWPAALAAVEFARLETAKTRRPPPLPPAIIAAARPSDEVLRALDPAERAVLDAAAGGLDPSTLGGVLAHLEFGAVQAATATLWRAGLLCAATGTAEAVADDGYVVTEAMLDRWLLAAKNEDFAALLGIAAGADEGAVRKAYYQTVRRFHPDRFRGGPLAARHREIEQAFRVVHEALALLTDPRALSDYNERKRQAAQRPTATSGSSRATELFQRAERSLDAGRLAEAAQFLEQAAAAEPGEPHFALHLCLVLLGNPARRADARARLARLAQEHAERADVLAAYALALAKSGQLAESAPFVRRALDLDPQSVLARALAGNTSAVRSAKGDRFLKLLF